MTIDHDNDRDAMLTAYALDELDEAGRAAVERRLADDAAARGEVEEIRATARLLQAELAAEPLPELAPAKTLRIRRARSWRTRLAVAAAVGIVVGAGAGSIWLLSRPQTGGDIALRTATTQPSTETAATVVALRMHARQLIRDTRYAEALGVVDQILALDPTNDYATGIRPLVSDKALSEQQRHFREDLDRQVTRQLSESEAKKVPYDDILRYPSDWPDVSPSPQPATPAQQPQQQQSFAAAASPTPDPAVQFADPLNAPTFNLQHQRQAGQQQPGLFGTNPTAQTAAAAPSAQGGYGFHAPSAVGAGFKRDISIGAEYAVSSDINPGTGDDGFNTEAYDRIVDNRFLEVVQNPLSTFSIDVDTASYSNMRRFLTRGQLPPKDSVRIEELVNYFPYDYAPPNKDAEDPFAAHVEVAECPWETKHRLVRIGLKGREIAADKRPASNLVFLLDVSGSMNSPNKLPLVQRSMRMLLNQLNGEDRVAIVVYAGHSGMVLSSTACTDREKPRIEEAIDSLSAGGSTNGEQGIQLAYTVATQNFIEGGTNRVILCTDGDFNVGVTSEGDLTRTIEAKAKSGVFLSVLGFGMGNLKDSTMETLADKGNGNYGYIDTESEAKKLLVEQMSGTLITIAKDVKIQVEFNPAVVGAYRLIGYENRMLAKEDFNDDKKDAGEIGAGHAVTALYEVVPVGTPTTGPGVDPLKYQKPAVVDQPRIAGLPEMLTLKLRYKQPDGDTSKLIEVPVKDGDRSFEGASLDFKFASAVAGFGMILRESPHKGSATVDAVLGWAEGGLGDDASGYRREFIELVKRSRAIAPDATR